MFSEFSRSSEIFSTHARRIFSRKITTPTLWLALYGKVALWHHIRSTYHYRLVRRTPYRHIRGMQRDHDDTLNQMPDGHDTRIRAHQGKNGAHRGLMVQIPAQIIAALRCHAPQRKQRSRHCAPTAPHAAPHSSFGSPQSKP